MKDIAPRPSFAGPLRKAPFPSPEALARSHIDIQLAAQNVGDLRSFMAILDEDDVGLSVCAGGFTKDAESEARTQEKRKVTLVDLDRLFDLWVEYCRKLEETARRRLPLRPIHFLAPAS